MRTQTELTDTGLPDSLILPIEAGTSFTFEGQRYRIRLTTLIVIVIRNEDTGEWGFIPIEAFVKLAIRSKIKADFGFGSEEGNVEAVCRRWREATT